MQHTYGFNPLKYITKGNTMYTIKLTLTPVYFVYKNSPSFVRVQYP